MTLTFDSVDLMATPYIVRYIKHDGNPDRRLEREKLSRSRGTILLDEEFGEKVFEMAGKITGTSQANLEANIDTFKELMSRKSKNLDIGYGVSTRRYVAYVDDLKIDRDFYHLVFAPFSLKFIVPDGIGVDPTPSDIVLSNQTGASVSGNFTIEGSAYPEPEITFSFDSASSATKLELTVNGDKITITTAISASDILVIDCANKKITKNGTEIDYTGIFPRFIVGSNPYVIAITSSSHQYDMDLKYSKTYL